ncbi:Hypothetical protein FKW44_024859, partial [Caligus rogercresseyi]
LKMDPVNLENLVKIATTDGIDPRITLLRAADPPPWDEVVDLADVAEADPGPHVDAESPRENLNG